MKLNKDVFFKYARRAPFGGRITPQQFDGINQLLDFWFKYHADLPSQWLAYILATVFHETGGRMVPVREGFATSDAGARKAVQKLFDAGRISKNYALPVDAKGKPNINGNSYYGRGRVQNTWWVNYKNLEQRFGELFVEQPDLLLDGEIDAKVTIVGHIEGLWTPANKKLSDYFNDEVNDPIGARAIVNGKDKAKLIASYYQNFLDSIEAAYSATEAAQEVQEPIKPLVVDKTTIGAVAGFVSAGGAGFLGAIDNPWALGAVAVLAIAGFLFFTGRFNIRYNTGE